MKTQLHKLRPAQSANLALAVGCGFWFGQEWSFYAARASGFAPQTATKKVSSLIAFAGLACLLCECQTCMFPCSPVWAQLHGSVSPLRSVVPCHQHKGWLVSSAFGLGLVLLCECQTCMFPCSPRLGTTSRLILTAEVGCATVPMGCRVLDSLCVWSTCDGRVLMCYETRTRKKKLVGGAQSFEPA